MANQLAASSFEEALTAGQWATSANATLTRTAVADAQHGSYVGRLSASSASTMTAFNDVGNSIPVTPGQQWSVGAYARRVAGLARNFRVDLMWYNAANTLLTTVLGTSGGGGLVTGLGTTWTRAVNQGQTAPANAAYVRIRVAYVSAATNDTIDIDALQVEQGATIPAYNPGPGGAAQNESGGSTASVTVVAVGAGTASETASGGSAATVTIAATGGGTKTEEAPPEVHSGGSTASVGVTTVGAGAATETAAGGSESFVGVVAGGDGIGLEVASGGALAEVVILATGGGIHFDGAARDIDFELGRPALHALTLGAPTGNPAALGAPDGHDLTFGGPVA